MRSGWGSIAAAADGTDFDARGEHRDEQDQQEQPAR